MDARLPWLTFAWLFVGTLASSAQRARSAPEFQAPELAFVAPRWLADLTEGPTNHGAVAAGDLDNDGDVDLLAYHYPNEYTPDAIQSWRNDGEGRFTLARSTAFSVGGDLQLADVTADGVLDLVLLRNWHPGDTAAVEVDPGLGDGGFAGWIEIAGQGHSGGAFATGDCDADGDLDILFFDPSIAAGQSSLAWWRYEGGSFVPGAPLPISGESLSAFAGLDLDGDGATDVVAFALAANALNFYRTVNGAPVLEATVPLPSVFHPSTRHLRTGDLDADGDEDVLVVTGGDIFYSLPVFHTAAGFAAGPLQATPDSFEDGYVRAEGELVDWDEDGDADYLSPTFVWMENTGGGSFTRAGWAYWGLYSDNNSKIVVTDLDSDGHADAFAQWSCFYGDGKLPERVSNPTSQDLNTLSSPSSLEDWEGDGDLDLDSPSQLYLNNGDGSFVRRATPLESSGSVQLIDTGWGDFDGDGFRDRVVAVDVYPVGFARMELYTGTENGTYQLSPTVPSAVEMSSGLAGDLDGDGDVDILATHGFWQNDGTGRFGSAVVAAYVGQPVFALDFDRDGDLDLLVNHGGNLELVRHLDGLSFEIVPLGIGALTASRSSLMDLDADGDLDLAITRPTTGTVLLFEQRPGPAFIPVVTLEKPGADGAVGQIDVDEDGRLDLVACGSFDGSGAYIPPIPILSAWIRGQGLTFTQRHDWVTSDAPLGFGDIDRDGDVEPIGAGIFENLRYDGPNDGSAVQYGLAAATSGTGGIHPVLGSGASARPGRLSRLVIGRGRGGAFGVLLAGDARDNVLDGGIRRLVLDPITPRSFVLDGTPGAPGKGTLVLNVHVIPSLIGRTRDFQVVLVDPEASSGLSATNGLEVHFGE
jgi:hypothetical protein